MIKHRIATLDDVPMLARMNRQLVEDEKHRNRLKSDAWLEDRMRQFLTGEYEAVVFEIDDHPVAYALYRQHPDHEDTVYLRQIFVDRSHRRQGIGREAMRILKETVWPANKRITVEVLVGNQMAQSFYEASGFKPYSLELELSASARNTQPGAEDDVVNRAP
jgi:ribosomal protein S18 acetylase RimI-like enzyme